MDPGIPNVLRDAAYAPVGRPLAGVGRVGGEFALLAGIEQHVVLFPPIGVPDFYQRLPQRSIAGTRVPTENPEGAGAVADLGRGLIPFPANMIAMLVAFLAAFRASVRSRLALEAEIFALRHQLAVLQRQAPRRLRLGRADRLLWVLLSRIWPNWRRAVQIVTPDTVVRWHRRGFALYWRWKSKP
jgi:hypothetical protein